MIEGLALHLRGALDGDEAQFLELRVEVIGVLLAVAILLVEPAQAVDEERRLELGECRKPSERAATPALRGIIG